MRNPKEIAETIENLVKEKQTTVNKMLAECGLTKDTIRNMKNGKKPFSDTVAVIAQYFEVSTDYLLGNENDTNDPVSDGQLKFALFGDPEIDDDVLEDIKAIAKLHYERKKEKRAEK